MLSDWKFVVKVQEVFTPNDIPTVTYVDRTEQNLEARLKEMYETPNMVISVSGPSKSGKTVLIKKVVADEDIIPVRGAGIESADALWERVLDWMGTPSTVAEASSTTNEITGVAEASGKLGIPLVAEGAAKTNIGGKRGWGGTETKTYRRTGIEQVIKEIAKSNFAVFIDDFHYIKPGVREEVAKQIKVAAENGVKIIAASVLHRSDDVLLSNPELRGRVVTLGLTPWSANELTMIARKGFTELNVDLAPEIERRFAIEAFGSPQLMQSICLNLAHVLGVKETQPAHVRMEVSPEQVTETLLRTSAFADFSRVLRDLHIGAKTRGTDRNVHNLIDGTRGDVYRAILLAMRQDPATLSFNYDNITARVRQVCIGDAPTGSSVNAALTQMHIIAEDLQPGNSPISWDDPTLDISDPYFLFFLRCSDKLAQIANPDRRPAA